MIEINKIKHYGWCYRTSPLKDTQWWWYSVADEEIYSSDELKEKFSFDNYDDIILTGTYIPLWKTDEYEVTESFLRGLKNKEADKYLENKKNTDRFIEFEYYIENHKNYITAWWYEYSDKRITEDAVKWCRENGIPYIK